MSPFFTQKKVITVGALEIPGHAETCVAWASFGQMAIFLGSWCGRSRGGAIILQSVEIQRFFRDVWRYLWDIYEIFMKIFMRYLWVFSGMFEDIYEIFMRYLWRYLWYIYEFFQGCLKIFMRYLWRYLWDIYEFFFRDVLRYGCVWKCRVPLNPMIPMVLLIIIPFLNGYNWEYTLFSDKPIFMRYLWDIYEDRWRWWKP